jgi:MFS family permease
VFGFFWVRLSVVYATRLPRPLPNPFHPILSHPSTLILLTKPSYAVDSLILLIQSIIAAQAGLEFKPSYANGLTIAAYVGMLVGALFWGISADVIGRKTAFNFSLLICSVFAIVAGASPSWEVLGLFVCLSSFGAGGNLVLDTAVFLEYLPSSRQWMLTLMAAWWGELWMCCAVTISVEQQLTNVQASASSLRASLRGRLSPTTAAATRPCSLTRRRAHVPTTRGGATCGTRRAGWCLSCHWHASR